MQKIISRGALLFLFVAVLSLIIFLSGCGGGGAGSGMSALNGDNMSATQGSSKELKTQQALPQDTLAFIEEEGKRYKEYLSQVKSDSNYPGPLLDFTNNAFIQNGTRTSRDTYDPEKYLCLPNGSVYYSLNGTPFMGSNGPLIFLATYTSTGDRKEIPLTGITAKKAHFLVFAGCSPDVPNRHVGTITMLYKDGTTNQLELTMGTNVAEWAYDRPELQGHILHSKVPSGYDFSTTEGSHYQYNGHFFYVSIDLQEKELTSMALSMDSDMHQQGDRYFDLNIAGMTLELKSVSELSIDDAKATPEEFVPPGTTTITATVTAKDFTPVDLNWTLTIKNDKTGATANTSTGTTTQISAPWELNKAKNFPGYGNYTFEIKATCKNSEGKSYDAEATGTIKVKPPTPKITLIKFVQPIRMVDDNGEKIETVYYSEKDGVVKQNPIAFAWSEIGATSSTVASQTVSSKGAGDSSKNTTLKMTFQLEKAPLEPITYKFRSFSAEQGEIILKDYSVAFEKHKTEKESDITIVAPQMVNYIDDLKWQYCSESEDGGTTPTYNDLIQTQEPICVALYAPVIKKDSVYNSLLVIASKQAKKAKTEDEIRKKLVSGTWEYLNNNDFCYDAGPGSDFCDFSGIWDQHIKFHYSAWKHSLIDGKHHGSCVATSALYATLCSLLGADMNLKRIYSSEYNNALNVNLCMWFGRLPTLGFDDKMKVTMHQVGCYKNLMYDPVFFFQSGSYVQGLSKTDYINTLVIPAERQLVQWKSTGFGDIVYDVVEVD